jgi:hypothetical protein
MKISKVLLTALHALASAMLLLFFIGNASAQLPIKIPKVSKPKPQPTPTEDAEPAPASETRPSQPQPDNRNAAKRPSSVGNTAGAEDQPTIAKDSVRVFTANISGSLDAPKDISLQWKPGISFRVNGPIASGSQLWVEFGYPGRKNWAKFDCKTGEIAQGQWWQVSDCTATDKMTTPYVGPVDFSIHLRNELQGTTVTLFTGKAKVAKFIGPAGPQYPEFYVDDDWRIPIGYVFYEHSTGHRATFLNVGFWYRGNTATLEAHLFYQGKEIAKYFSAGNEGSDWKPAAHQWGFANCQFVGVYKDDPGEDGYDPRFAVAKNPGEYEVKVLVAHHLARSIKFIVNADGSFDNGIANANKLGSDRVIVPAQVIGDLSPWDRNAWKADAFYGNPLTGFSAP